jgi:general secretion pathway protein G
MANPYPCPSCGEQIAVPEHLIGHQVMCPRCQHQFIVPGPGGAPVQAAQPAPRSSTNVGVIIAVIAVVGFIGIFVLGIIAAIAIPNMLNAINRGRQKRTLADMRTLGTALEAYAVDNDTYPPGITSVEELQPLLCPDYLASLPLSDGWNQPFIFTSDAEGLGYEIISYGRDLAPGPDDGGYVEGFTDFDYDMIYQNGHFVQYPLGTRSD